MHQSSLYNCIVPIIRLNRECYVLDKFELCFNTLSTYLQLQLSMQIWYICDTKLIRSLTFTAKLVPSTRFWLIIYTKTSHSCGRTEVHLVIYVYI